MSEIFFFRAAFGTAVKVREKRNEEAGKSKRFINVEIVQLWANISMQCLWNVRM